jgi:hypothetical protein
LGVFLDYLESCIKLTTAENWEKSLERMANRLKAMRSFDLECFDLPDTSKLQNRDPAKIRTKEEKQEIVREKIRADGEEIRRLGEETQSLRKEIENRQAEIARLENQYRELINRRDWRLLTKLNRIPGVPTIKRILRKVIP